MCFLVCVAIERPRSFRRLAIAVLWEPSGVEVDPNVAVDQDPVVLLEQVPPNPVAPVPVCIQERKCNSLVGATSQVSLVASQAGQERVAIIQQSVGNGLQRGQCVLMRTWELG